MHSYSNADSNPGGRIGWTNCAHPTAGWHQDEWSVLTAVVVLSARRWGDQGMYACKRSASSVLPMHTMLVTCTVTTRFNETAPDLDRIPSLGF